MKLSVLMGLEGALTPHPSLNEFLRMCLCHIPFSQSQLLSCMQAHTRTDSHSHDGVKIGSQRKTTFAH